ncbi:hypothetical protein [Brevibacillus sp. 179-C9.3 HS]|uniref:hypothetical protein n=1 Tax=unclassified Brevibacillus TaxID=2684853 RepID=UPI00399EF5F7
MPLEFIGTSNNIPHFQSGVKVHYYELHNPSLPTIKVYVSDVYQQKYGMGYGYSEIEDIFFSLIEAKNAPHLLDAPPLTFYFFSESQKNQPEIPMAKNRQAWASSQDHTVEIFLYADSMPYDFRYTLVHEIVHYFDYKLLNSDAIINYWGYRGRNWLLEGSAEYGSYFCYSYPPNTYNTLEGRSWLKDKAAIIEYTKMQGKGFESDPISLLHAFGDVPRNTENYGIFLSFYWYLQNTYNTQLLDYVNYVMTNYANRSNITQSEMNEVATKFLGKSETEVLRDWLSDFNYFR